MQNTKKKQPNKKLQCPAKFEYAKYFVCAIRVAHNGLSVKSSEKLTRGNDCSPLR